MALMSSQLFATKNGKINLSNSLRISFLQLLCQRLRLANIEEQVITIHYSLDDIKGDQVSI